tara:strand:- start:24546 stop:24746 length:201 start_codon:yes stop_codon:yes gene_type:complete
MKFMLKMLLQTLAFLFMCGITVFAAVGGLSLIFDTGIGIASGFCLILLVLFSTFITVLETTNNPGE